MKKKLIPQLLSLVLIALLFAGFLFSLWFFVTRRCKANFGENVQLKSIEPEKYLPFDEDSLIVREDGTVGFRKTYGFLPSGENDSGEKQFDRQIVIDKYMHEIRKYAKES